MAQPTVREFRDDSQPASFYNKEPILDVVRRVVPADAAGLWLETASGHGAHVAHFAPVYPHIRFQPTEYDPECLPEIVAATMGLTNVLPPVRLDCAASFASWQEAGVQEGVYLFSLSVNMAHISPWECTVGLFAGLGRALKSGGILFMYGYVSGCPHGQQRCLS